MSARDAILGRIREALRATPESTIERRYSTSSRLTRDEVVNLFAERVAEYNATVIRCDPNTAPHEIADALSDVAPGEVLLAEGLDTKWIGKGIEDTGVSNLDLDRFKAVVTSSAVAVAETGTIILDHQRDGQGRRAVSLLPDRHVCIVLTSQVVGSVPEALARLNPRRHQTWISGPSATSDIELDRVEGVHGPRDLRVILIADSP
jgi:L-lactate dehydrogenase complex protein LldG